MPRSRLASGGFTLIELAVTLTVLGLLLAFSVPAFQQINRSYRLKNAVQHAAGDMRMWRERAIASGNSVRIHYNNLYNADWHMHEYDPNGVQIRIIPGGRYANGVTQYTTSAAPKFEKDGRVSNGQGTLILQSTIGGQTLRDTVSVLSSGLILVK